MLHLILGSAGSEKSKQLIRDMTEKSLEYPGEKFFAVVPEQATLTMQQNVVAHLKRGATFNIDVVSFDRLAQVVFSDLGIGVKNVLDDTGKVLVLRQVLEECREDLQVYRSKVHMPGFAEKIKSAITELKQYGIDDNELFLMQESAQAGGNRLLFAKLQDLRLISRKFDEKIRDAYRVSEETLELFASVAANAQRLQGSHIYLDGYTGFTPVQYRLLAELLKTAKDVTVSLSLPGARIRDNCPEYDLYYLSNQTYFKLLKTAHDAGSEVAVSDLSEPAGESAAKPCRIFAGNRMQDEVTFAAKEILRLVKEKQLRYREIAVITSDMESYHRLAETTFRDAGIPAFIDHKAGILEHPLSRYVLSALRLSEERFSYDSIFSLLKTGLTDVEADEISLLENYCLEFGINGFRAWNSEMEKNRTLSGLEPSEEEKQKDPYAGQRWNLEEVNAIREKAMHHLAPFYDRVRKKGLNAVGYAGALRKLLADEQIEEKLEEKAKILSEEGRLIEQREYEQVYGLVTELLEKTEILSPEEPVTIHDYRTMIESGLSEIRVGVIPPTIDAVTVGDLTRTRLDHIRVLFLIGVNEGKIPSASDPSGILSQRDREFLKNEKFEMAPSALENMYIQRFYIHLMLHQAKEMLYLTYSKTNENGEGTEPAYIIEELEELAGPLAIETVSEMPEIKWKKQALKELSAAIRNEPEEALLQFFAKEEPDMLRSVIEGAFFTNRQTALDPQVTLDLYGDVLSGSVSRYEKFSECPFKHFLNYGIRLEKRPEYEIAAADVGTIYHSTLECYAKKIQESAYSFRNIPDDVSREFAQESVEEALAEMPSDILDSSVRNEYFVKRIREVAVKTTDVLREHVRAGLYDPAEYELQFQERLNEHVRFKGKIDRVDIYDGEDLYVKIIDYKSGNKQFRIADLYSGLDLQLVAYLKEAISHYETKYPDKQVRPGGVYYYRINDHFSKTEEESKERFRMSGVTSCEQGMVQAVDGNLISGQPGSSTIIPVKYQKNGNFSKASEVANNDEFENMMHFTGRKIEEISEKILSGDIEILPYYEQERKNACAFCDYREVCKFEAGRFGTDWKEKTILTKEEMEAEIYGRIQAE